MGKRIAGTCFVKVDGEQLELKGGIEVPLSQKKRESVESVSGTTGYYKETDVTPFIKGTFLVPRDFPLKKITESDSLTVTAELANGWVYTLSEAYTVDDQTLKGDEGEVEVTFNGKRGSFQ